MLDGGNSTYKVETEALGMEPLLAVVAANHHGCFWPLADAIELLVVKDWSHGFWLLDTLTLDGDFRALHNRGRGSNWYDNL